MEIVRIVRLALIAAYSIDFSWLFLSEGVAFRLTTYADQQGVKKRTEGAESSLKRIVLIVTRCWSNVYPSHIMPAVPSTDSWT